MDNAGPSFTIYQDPPDQQQQQQQSSSTNQHIQHYSRPPLAEIRLLSWGADAHCDSSLKHEMLIPQLEPSSSSTPPDDASCVESEESKENIDSRPVDAHSFKTPPRKVIYISIIFSNFDYSFFISPPTCPQPHYAHQLQSHYNYDNIPAGPLNCPSPNLTPIFLSRDVPTGQVGRPPFGWNIRSTFPQATS
ncbi:uncharacterized protein VP01_1551g2 [Puccinia sorghi]|uniref:Uncharacterized protein n=1 Tax=Puccinia sorghi TaxID=27349 RepID=A0A0L6VIB2_9BASI|nr:uncharacterized protein VP01_1551g2 [Puccinia sorghi]